MKYDPAEVYSRFCAANCSILCRRMVSVHSIFAQGDLDCIDGGRKDVIENGEVDGGVEASDDDQQLEKD